MQGLSTPAKVTLCQRDITDEIINRRKPDTKREFAGGALNDIEVENGEIVRGALTLNHFDRGEVTESADVAFGACTQSSVEGVFFDQFYLAADDLVKRTRVSSDVNALDVDALAFLNTEDDINGLGFLIASNLRAHIRKNETFFAQQQNDITDGFFNRGSFVRVSGFKLNQ